MNTDRGKRLICALDVACFEEAERAVDLLAGAVSFYKVGLQLFISEGPRMVNFLRSRDLRVFLDLKIFDVPETVENAVEQASKLDVDFLTVHGNGDIIRAAIKGKGASKLRILAVTVLTSMDQSDISELGFPCDLKDLVMKRAVLARDLGCDGIVCSPEEVFPIRSVAGKGLTIVTPGIRPSWSCKNDHKRLASPRDAIENGADYLVVGRPILNSENPHAAALRIIEEMEG